MFAFVVFAFDVDASPVSERHAHAGCITGISASTAKPSTLTDDSTDTYIAIIYIPDI